MNRSAGIALGLAAGAAAGAAVAAVGATGSSSRPESPPRRALAPPAAQALAIPSPRPLDDGPQLTRWTVVRRAVVARTAPGLRARRVARIARLTPEGTPTALPVSGRRTGPDGRLWLRVTLPVLPNGTRGWIPRRAVGAYDVNRHRLVIDLAAQRLTLMRRGSVIMRAPVGVGLDRWPTPRGTFLIRNRLTRYASPEYGPVAFGTSARSPTLTDWPAGGFIGIHGTNRPDLLPGKVSHGCVRLRNTKILSLARLMPVGTPVEIR